jgi:CheY-like chemotaxis protein
MSTARLNEVLKDKTVLIADDDVRNIFSLTKSLEKHQMRVISATDGKEALAQLQQPSRNLNRVNGYDDAGDGWLRKHQPKYARTRALKTCL